jgi:hypothetical protein
LYKGTLAIGHVGSASEYWTSGVTRDGVASHGYCAIPYMGGIEQDFAHSKQTHNMDTTTKTALVIAFAVVALVLLIFGNGSTGVIGWMLLPTLFVVVLDVMLFSVIFGKTHV